MHYICQTNFKLSELGYLCLQRQIADAVQNSTRPNEKIAMNNPECFTCNVRTTVSWLCSIAKQEINSAFPTFTVTHLRLLTKHPMLEVKETDPILHYNQKNAIIANVTPAAVWINFYPIALYGKISYLKLKSESTDKKISHKLLPNVFYLINQSVTHKYTTTDNSAKIFSAATNSVVPLIFS
jgi:hypothetical protein